MKARSSRKTSLLHEESGQAAVLIAIFLFFALLTFASLAIDGAMFYLVRRDLQNVADATTLGACRVLSEGGSSSEALTEAQTIVFENLGASAAFVGASPPVSNVGTGTGLLKGIEVLQPQVRVALQRPIPSVLTQFVGRTETIVTARARCDARAGGGLMPIAIQRYDGEPGGTLTDYLGNKGAPVYPSDSITETWDGRYGPYLVPVPMAQYETSDGTVAAANTGPEIVILGQSAETNNNEQSMRDLVLLDVRNVASVNSLEYYNGADSQANAAKDMSQNWIYQQGYPGPYPQGGSQVAILDGASNNFTAQAMDTAGYRPGDAIAAIVYDGFVWSTPDFAIELIPNANDGIASSYPIDTFSAVSYQVDISKAGAANVSWFNPLNFDLTFDFAYLPLPSDTHITLNGTELFAPNFSYTVNSVTEAGWNAELRIWSTEAITVGQFLSGLNLTADSSVGLIHGTSSNFGFGPIGANYALRTNSGEIVIRQDSSVTANLITFGVGSSFPTSGGGCKNVPVHADILVGGVAQNWNSFFTSSQDTSVDIRKDTEKSQNLALSATATALVGNYTLRLNVGPKTCSGVTLSARTIKIPLEIKPPAPNAAPNKFVFIQGYAVFRISRTDANDVWGYSISPLYQNYEDIRVGLHPRLVAWE